jgi:alkaline phosphatase
MNRDNLESGNAASNVSRRDLIKVGAMGTASLLAGTAAASSARATESASSEGAAASGASLKHVFLFIGDGMGDHQIQLASFFQGAVDNGGAVVQEHLSFQDFPYVGSVTTFDSSSFIPDSASTATSIASGFKTLSGVINMDPETLSTPYETIAEKLHTQQGWKIGVLTSVNVNHATPAAFYAHQDDRHNYYAIGEELAQSGFEFFAGGEFIDPTGADGDKTDLKEVAASAGYNVITTQADAEALKAGDADKNLIIAETLADEDSMSYDMDAAEGEWRLADYVDKAIEVLSGDDASDVPPFFMMVEGGKIDWACHANDAAASIHDVLALGKAVESAVAFYEAHPDDTLILVTADHETGGESIGFATTGSSTYLRNLTFQKMSQAKFDTEVVGKYRDEKRTFAEALDDAATYFGLVTSDDDETEDDDHLVLTEYEIGMLQDAFERQMTGPVDSQDAMSQRDFELYGEYLPFSMCLCHILDQKSGVGHTTYEHTGAPVGIYALGCGAEQFQGAFDNTEIYFKLASLTNVQ